MNKSSEVKKRRMEERLEEYKLSLKEKIAECMLWNDYDFYDDDDE